jgi:hypothetical protein
MARVRGLKVKIRITIRCIDKLSFSFETIIIRKLCHLLAWE